MGLTKKQKALLDFIIHYQQENGGVSPTLREMADFLGVKALSTIHGYLSRLRKKGYLQWQWNEKRGVKPQKLTDNRKIPLLGYIAAGKPIESIPDPTLIEVPSILMETGEHYLLKVKGDSMVEAGIWDGDMIVVVKAEKAENGQMVVALVNGEVTLKRFYRENGRIRLQPANPRHSPIFCRPEEVCIQGIVVGLLRKY